MAIAGTVIETRALYVLNDDNTRWVDAEITVWINDAQKAIVTRKPDANVVTEAKQLAAGSQQSLVGLASTAIQLVDIIRNTTTGDGTPGATITETTLESLASIRPNWGTETAAATVKHWMRDSRDPLVFHVYPKQPGSSMGYVLMSYGGMPTDLATLAANIDLPDIYLEPIVDYVLYRCFSKDADLSPINAQRAIAHYNAFLAALGVKEQMETITEQGGK